jgi:hypothetical protein
MYGGGFATIPADLRDMFAPALSVPYIACRRPCGRPPVSHRNPRAVLVSGISHHDVDNEIPKARRAYEMTMQPIVARSVVGFLCNLCTKAVHRGRTWPATKPTCWPRQIEKTMRIRTATCFT